MTSPSKAPAATVKSEEKKRNAVFRQLLDSPFNVTWKSVDNDTSTVILDVLCSLIAPLAAHSPHPPTESKKRKRSKLRPSSGLPQQTSEPHPISNSVTLGFNQTVERLESEIRGKEITSMAAVFVARGDTTSTQLYAQFPLMAGMLPHLRLVSLAKGAEERLCRALSLRRVGVIGILVGAPGAETLLQLVDEKVPKIDLPWMKDLKPSFVPTRVKWIESIPNARKRKKEGQHTSGTKE